MSTVSGLLLETDLAMKPFLEQTVVRQGSSVFCEAKVPKPNGSECSRRSGMSVFAGKARPRYPSFIENMDLFSYAELCEYFLEYVVGAGFARYFTEMLKGLAELKGDKFG